MPQSTVMTSGDQIRELRKQRGWSQKDFHEKLKLKNVGYRTLQRAEKGGPISAAKLRQIAQVLGVSINDIIADENDSIPTQDLRPGQEIVALKRDPTARDIFEIFNSQGTDDVHVVLDVDPESTQDAEIYVNLINTLKRIRPDNGDTANIDGMPRQILLRGELNERLHDLLKVNGAAYVGSFTKRSYSYESEGDHQTDYTCTPAYYEAFQNTFLLVYLTETKTEQTHYEVVDVGQTLAEHLEWVKEKREGEIELRGDFVPF